VYFSHSASAPGSHRFEPVNHRCRKPQTGKRLRVFRAFDLRRSPMDSTVVAEAHCVSYHHADRRPFGLTVLGRTPRKTTELDVGFQAKKDLWPQARVTHASPSMTSSNTFKFLTRPSHPVRRCNAKRTGAPRWTSTLARSTALREMRPMPVASLHPSNLHLST